MRSVGTGAWIFEKQSVTLKFYRENKRREKQCTFLPELNIFHEVVCRNVGITPFSLQLGAVCIRMVSFASWPLFSWTNREGAPQ